MLRSEWYLRSDNTFSYCGMPYGKKILWQRYTLQAIDKVKTHCIKVILLKMYKHATNKSYLVINRGWNLGWNLLRDGTAWNNICRLICKHYDITTEPLNSSQASNMLEVNKNTHIYQGMRQHVIFQTTISFQLNFDRLFQQQESALYRVFTI